MVGMTSADGAPCLRVRSSVSQAWRWVLALKVIFCQQPQAKCQFKLQQRVQLTLPLISKTP